MRGEEILHVVGVLFLGLEDLLEHLARRRIVVAEVADDLAVRVDRDALGDEVLLDHVDQRAPLHVLRVAARREPLSCSPSNKVLSRNKSEWIKPFGRSG